MKHFTSSSSSSRPSTLPLELPSCQKAPLLSSSSLHPWNTEEKMSKIQQKLETHFNISNSSLSLKTKGIIYHLDSPQYSNWDVYTPAHGLTEPLSGQEACVLPDLSQSALEFSLVLVLQPLLLSFLFVAPTLLPVVQPEKDKRICKNWYSPAKSSCFVTVTVTYTSTILGVSSFRGIGFFFSKTSGVRVTGALLMAARISLWSSWDANNMKK